MSEQPRRRVSHMGAVTAPVVAVVALYLGLYIPPASYVALPVYVLCVGAVTWWTFAEPRRPERYVVFTLVLLPFVLVAAGVLISGLRKS